MDDDDNDDDNDGVSVVPRQRSQGKIVNSLTQCTRVKGVDGDDNDVVAVVPRQRSPGGNHEQPDPMHTRQRWVSMG